MGRDSRVCFRQPKLALAVAQIDYNLVGRFFDCRGKIIDAFLDSFDQMALGQDQNIGQTLALSDSKRSKTLLASPKRTSFRNLEPKSLDHFLEEALRKTNTVCSILDIESVSRIGLRTMWSIEFKGSFPKLVDLVRDAMYPAHTELWESYGSNPSDVGYALNFSLGELCNGLLRINANFGPMKEQEFRNRISNECHYPNVGLFLDLDVFLIAKHNSVLMVSQLPDILKDFGARTTRSCQGTVSFVGGGKDS